MKFVFFLLLNNHANHNRAKYLRVEGDLDSFLLVKNLGLYLLTIFFIFSD